MAAILSKTIGNPNKMAAFWFGFGMVGTIAIAFAMTDHLKLNRWKSELQNFQCSNVFGIPMFGIQAPTAALIQVLQ